VTASATAEATLQRAGGQEGGHGDEIPLDLGFRV
jgi:hypothetical protein